MLGTVNAMAGKNTPTPREATPFLASVAQSASCAADSVQRYQSSAHGLRRRHRIRLCGWGNRGARRLQVAQTGLGGPTDKHITVRMLQHTLGTTAALLRPYSRPPGSRRPLLPRAHAPRAASQRAVCGALLPANRLLPEKSASGKGQVGTNKIGAIYSQFT